MRRFYHGKLGWLWWLLEILPLQDVQVSFPLVMHPGVPGKEPHRPQARMPIPAALPPFLSSVPPSPLLPSSLPDGLQSPESSSRGHSFLGDDARPDVSERAALA